MTTRALRTTVNSSTRLSHHDPSLDNVLIDDIGMPVMDAAESHLVPFPFTQSYVTRGSIDIKAPERAVKRGSMI